MKTNVRLIVMAASPLLMVGCAAPSGSQDLSMKSFQTNVQLGRQHPLPAPLPPVHAAPPPNFPAPVALPPTHDELVLATPSPVRKIVSACPRAKTDAFPAEPASESVPNPLGAGDYPYRQTGTVTVGSLTGPIFPTFTRSISKVTSTTPASGGTQFTYVQSDSQPGGASIETSYLTVTGSPESGDDGIYLQSQTAKDSKGQVVGQFTPANSIEIMQLPAEGLTSTQGWTSAGTDPLNGIAMKLQGLVTGRERVDACGKVIDAWKVKLDVQILYSNGDQTTETLTNAVATEYGGRIVGTDVTLKRVPASGSQPVYSEHVVQYANSQDPVGSDS